jgi:predicted acetyltransferase
VPTQIPALRLRPPRVDDEAAVRAAHEALLADDFFFALDLDDGVAFADWVETVERHHRGEVVRPDRVPASFLLAEVGGEVVGRTSVRFALNDWLRLEGGHIGYGVLPQHRRRGYATEILRQSLVVARAHGVDRVLVTCDDDNAGSAAVIEANGGVRDPQLPLAGEPPKRRYWID